jgi:pimeloyl-ACP methyl ester carboxylesterase
MTPPFRQEIRFAKTRDDLRIAYAVSGRGYPLVRATHWLTSIEHDYKTLVLGPWLREASARWALHRYNARGYGLSEGEGTPISLATLRLDLEAVVEAAKVDRFALWGQSGGAKPAIAYAVRHPERVSHLVIVGGTARSDTKRHSPDEQERYLAMLKLIELGWGQNHDAFLQMMTGQLFPGATLEQMRSFNQLQRLTTSPSHAAAVVRATGAADVSELLPQVRVPTLVMHCRGDIRVPAEEGRFIAASIPEATLVLLDSVNHTPLSDEPAFQEALQQMQAFLPSPGRTAEAHISFSMLTPRERDIVELVARGMDNAKIAAWFNLSEKTVRNNVSRIFDKLAVENRGQAIVLAREAGLGH